MRLTARSGPLGGVVKIICSYLLLHLFIGLISAYPHTPTDLSLQQSDNVDLVDVRSLQKRARCTTGANGRLQCDGDVPGVDETNERVAAYGVVGTLPSVFYTEWPMSLTITRQWAKCFWPDEPAVPAKAEYRFAMWERLVDSEYTTVQALEIAKRPRGVGPEDSAFYKDMFQKHIAQSFAELAAGDVYLVVRDDVVPDDRSWDVEKAWGGWEFPALTRNSRVDRILRKDPASDMEPRVMWQRGDGPQGAAPKGRRNPTKQVPLEDLDDEEPPA